MELRLFINPSMRAPVPLIGSELNGLSGLSVLLFWFAPVLAIFFPWYTYPGFKLYSGNVVSATIMLANDETAAKAPAFVKALVASSREIGYSALAVGNGILYFPMPWSIKLSAAGLCPYLDRPSSAVVRIYQPPPFYALRSEYEDFPLCK
jgi:hypothetical protein